MEMSGSASVDIRRLGFLETEISIKISICKFF
jgi:hypothetical protein